MTCASGFISIIDPFLNPDGSQWTGSITYTLRYATTAAGVTVVNAEQQFNVANGIDICLAPGLYTVVLQQSGFAYALSSEWGVPVSGGPYTVAEISSNVTLQGSFGSVTLTGAPTTGQVPTATSPSAATWQTPGGGGGLLLSRSITLNQSEVLNLFTSPQTLVPAQGAGTVVFLMAAVFQGNGPDTYTTDDNQLVLGRGQINLNVFSGSTGSMDTFLVYGFPVGVNGGSFENAAAFVNAPITATTTDENPIGAGESVTITAWFIVLSGVTP